MSSLGDLATNLLAYFTESISKRLKGAPVVACAIIEMEGEPYVAFKVQDASPTDALNCARAILRWVSEQEGDLCPNCVQHARLAGRALAMINATPTVAPHLH